MELRKRQRSGPEPPCIGADMHDARGIFDIAMLQHHAKLHCIHYDSLPQRGM